MRSQRGVGVDSPNNLVGISGGHSSFALQILTQPAGSDRDIPGQNRNAVFQQIHDRGLVADIGEGNHTPHRLRVVPLECVVECKGLDIDDLGIEADLTLIGKALSGGFYPISAVLSNSEVLGVLQPGEHGSTFGGNPLACAIARTALKVLVEEGMIENAAHQGAYFLDGLRKIHSDMILEVRGRGLMLAVEFHPEAGGARQVCEALKVEGILCKETHATIVRFAPPLIITRDQVDWALERIERVLTRA